MLAVKVCGLREQDNVSAIAKLNTQWMGFIFVKNSPRYFADAKYVANIKSVSEKIKKVGVFVNESIENIIALKKLHGLDMVQLHGDESIVDCEALKQQGVSIIKAFSVDEQFDFALITAYAPYVEMFLFDTKGQTNGGTGKQFDWNILNGKRFAKPFLLSGGIGPDDVTRIKESHHPDLAGIDVNSRFEISPGVKDVSKLKSFMEQIL